MCALMCSGRVGSSCSTSETRRVNLVTNPVISNESEKDREMFTTSGTYPWLFKITNETAAINLTNRAKPKRKTARSHWLLAILVKQIIKLKIKKINKKNGNVAINLKKQT